ncbi:hypothetical protein L7F22_017501 [Adiantum nelumboides]|nr:hypothetical protein [Adiantum nelumboides]
MESPISARSIFKFSQLVFVARKQVPSIPHSPPSARTSSKWASINHQARSYSPLRKGTRAHHHPSYSIDVWSDSDIVEPEVLREGSYSAFQSELAAVMIKIPINDDDEDNHENHELSNSVCRSSLKFSDDQSKGPQRDCQIRSKALDVAVLSLTKQGGSSSHTPTSGCNVAQGTPWFSQRWSTWVHFTHQ